MTLQDGEYVEKLKQCLARFGNTQRVKKVTDLWLNTVEEAERQSFEEAKRIRQQHLKFEESERIRQQQLKFEESERIRQQQLKFEESERIRQQQLITSKADFRKLDQLLSTNKWKEADQETANIMLKIMGREIQGYLDIVSCQNFPKDELKIIDQMWVKYSNGHFGFSVQKKIFTKIGGGIYGFDYDMVCKFGQEVEWKKKGFLGISNGWVIGNDWKLYDDLSFEILVSNKGHLPYGYRWWSGGGNAEIGFRDGYYFLFFRL